jgi:ribosomal protein S17E
MPREEEKATMSQIIMEDEQKETHNDISSYTTKKLKK